MEEMRLSFALSVSSISNPSMCGGSLRGLEESL
jgi:hypothetical protein